MPKSASREVELRLIDVNCSKDMLALLRGDADPRKWALHSETGEQNLRELTAEHKIVDRRIDRAVWLPLTNGVAHHAWDMEVYQCAAADWANGGIVPQQSPAPPAIPTAPAAPGKPLDRLTREFDEARHEHECSYVNLADL